MAKFTKKVDFKKFYDDEESDSDDYMLSVLFVMPSAKQSSIFQLIQSLLHLPATSKMFQLVGHLFSIKYFSTSK